MRFAHGGEGTYIDVDAIQIYDSSSIPTPAPPGWYASNYTYPTDIPHAVTSVDRGNFTDSFSYDENGNMTCRRESGVTYLQTYNAENRIASIQKLASGTCETPGTLTAKWDFTYDGDGVRTGQSYTPYTNGTPESVVITRYYFGGSLETQGSLVKKYYFFAGQIVAMKEGAELKYFLTDHLGSILAVSDSSGTLISQQRYLPFGEVRTDVGLISQTDFGYTGQRKLDEGMGGIMDYKARFFSPCIMQFNQPDTVIPDLYNPQSLNRYAYALNNPIRYTDSTGHRPEDGCNTTGCNRNEKQINDEQKALGKLKKWGDERKCRGGNKNYCVQMDEWAWDNIPSTVVIHKVLSGQAGFAGEFGQYREVAYAYNWRSFEAEKLYVEGRYAYMGTPQLWSIGLYRGVSLVYGASSVSSLEGASSAGGFTASLDGGGTINAAYAAGIAVNDNGVRLIDRDSGRPIQSYQINVGAGWNGIPNVADVGGILADEAASIGTPTGGWDKFWYYFLSGLP